MEPFRLPRVVQTIPDYATLIPPNPVHTTNDYLKSVSRLQSDQGQVLADLAKLATDEREARIAAERSTRRWQWAAFILGLVTLAVAIMAVLVGAG